MHVIINEGFLIKFQISDFSKKSEGINHTGRCLAGAEQWLPIYTRAAFSILLQTPPVSTAFPNPTGMVVCWAVEVPAFETTPHLILSQTLSPQ